VNRGGYLLYGGSVQQNVLPKKMGFLLVINAWDRTLNHTNCFMPLSAAKFLRHHQPDLLEPERIPIKLKSESSNTNISEISCTPPLLAFPNPYDRKLKVLGKHLSCIGRTASWIRTHAGGDSILCLTFKLDSYFALLRVFNMWQSPRCYCQYQ
jgi:hypothetical protein